MTDTLDDQLDEWLAGGADELYGPPENQEQTDRLLGALRKVKARQAEVDDVVKGRIDALRVWERQQRDQLTARETDLTRLLEGWARADNRATGRKTWKLPAGELRLRPLRERCQIDDRVTDGEAVDLVRELLPEAVRTKVSISVQDVKAAVEPGEVLDNYPAQFVPEGYEPRQALLPSAEDEDQEPAGGYTVLRGVVLLVPVDGPGGQVFQVAPR